MKSDPVLTVELQEFPSSPGKVRTSTTPALPTDRGHRPHLGLRRGHAQRHPRQGEVLTAMSLFWFGSPRRSWRTTW